MKKGTHISTKDTEIAGYWSARIYEGDLGIDWSDALVRCWRCAEQYKKLHRCHIIPRQEPFCGADKPYNFVLLCKICHEEAPSCSDSSEMWRWIKTTRCGFYGEYWIHRDYEEMKRVYGLDVQDEVIKRDAQACKAAYETILHNEVGIHFGTRSLSIASRVFVWRRVFLMVTPKQTECSNKHPRRSALRDQLRLEL